MIYLKLVLNVIFCWRLRSDRLLNIHYERFVFRFGAMQLRRFFAHSAFAHAREWTVVNLFHYLCSVSAFFLFLSMHADHCYCCPSNVFKIEKFY